MGNPAEVNVFTSTGREYCQNVLYQSDVGHPAEVAVFTSMAQAYNLDVAAKQWQNVDELQEEHWDWQEHTGMGCIWYGIVFALAV